MPASISSLPVPPGSARSGGVLAGSAAGSAVRRWAVDPGPSRAVAPKTVERIVTAAARLWCLHSDIPTIRAVAAEAGVGAATVANAFASIDELADAIVSRELTALGEIVSRHRDGLAEYPLRHGRAVDDLVSDLAHHAAELSRNDRALARLPSLAMSRAYAVGTCPFPPEVMIAIYATSALSLASGEDWGMTLAIASMLAIPPACGSCARDPDDDEAEFFDAPERF